jgi:hypothetical protein
MKLSQIMSQPRPAPAPGWSARELHARATIAATRGEAPPPPAPFSAPGAAAADAKDRALAAIPPAPKTTPARPPTPAEVDVANLPDASEEVQAIIDKSHRMAEAPTLDRAEQIRREGMK